MASAAEPKRMVSSVFITLAAPHRATGTQQPLALQAHAAPARDKQDTSARVSSSDNVSVLRHKAENHSSSDSNGSVNSKDWTHERVQSPKRAQIGSSKAQLQEEDLKRRKSPEFFPPPPVLDALPPSLGELVSEESTILPPSPPAYTFLPQPLTLDQQPVWNRKVETSTPSSGLKKDEQTLGIGENNQDTSRESKDLCGFCRKPIAPSEPAIEALNRIYHDGCFQCRSCHIPLAGKQFYNKAAVPLCQECYQASLEPCWACGEVITDYIIRALERPYHPSCFTCATCNQEIGKETFAQGEVGEIYCLQDYYRKYAPKCNACNQLIIPKEDGTDSYTVECLGHSYHENCFRCEICVIKLPPENGCFPLDGKLLCKCCHMDLVSGQH
ncbi:filamin-binding LIM protein 1 [Cololabis saira]|uniref:filamin-binding LIM protein 1 n=1 Tax=Cololabis saira TaxID=129043 RepID=UPI002AD3B566|nr:filamin-binding LIM protein 1 [Cololabis saira]